AATQTGCAISYATFRATSPPPENTLFGRVPGDMVAACTNPSALGGGAAAIHGYFDVAGQPFSAASAPFAWVTPARVIDTPFVSVPGLLTAQCISDEHGSYLAVTVHGDPSDPRTDDITGDVVVNGQVQADWGLHLIDVSLAIGNLVDIVGQQSKAYLATNKKGSNKTGTK